MITVLTDPFKKYLQQLGYGAGSCRILPLCAGVFLKRYEICCAQSITRSQVADFYEWLYVKPARNRKGVLSEMMIYHYMYSLRTFLNWLEHTGQISSNPMSTLQLHRPQRNTRLPLDQEQMSCLLRGCQNLEEETMLHLFYSCGLRRSEAEALNIRDVSLSDRCVYVRWGKGGRRRRIPVPALVVKTLSRYLYQYRGGAGPGDPFMINRQGRRMNGGGYYRMLKRLLQKSAYPELSETLSLHHLRHSIATHLLWNGVSVEFVRDFLGHKHLEATQIYAQVNQSELLALTSTL